MTVSQKLPTPAATNHFHIQCETLLWLFLFRSLSHETFFCVREQFSLLFYDYYCAFCNSVASVAFLCYVDLFLFFQLHNWSFPYSQCLHLNIYIFQIFLKKIKIILKIFFSINFEAGNFWKLFLKNLLQIQMKTVRV
jgi:hypothetical protein